MADYSEIIRSKDHIDIAVRTNCKKTKITEYDKEKDTFKMDVSAEPEKGKANQEIIRFFTRMTKKEVKMTKGMKSRKKTIKINQK